MNKQNKKAQTKGFIKGILFSFLIIATILSISAAQMTRTATLNYNNIKICIDGEYITPKDAAGNVVEPFIIDGTTYLPIRAVASAFGKEVSWDGATSTAFLGKKPNADDGQGKRSDPYSPTLGKTIQYNEYSFRPTHDVKVVCNKVIKGEGANLFMKKTNSYNDTPTANQEWIIFDLTLTHVNSSDGEDSLLAASDIIYEDNLFKPDGTSLAIADMGTFTQLMKGYGIFDIKLYPGGSSRVLYAVLTEKYDGDILLKVPYNGGDNNIWIKLNSDSNVITTRSEVNKHFGVSI